MQAFLSTVIDMAQNNAEFTDALLRNQNHDSLSVLLAMLGFRKYLAADYAFPDESLHVEVDAGAAHAAKKQEEAHA